ncbi:hypothetical protein AB833_31290 [Chromatiales bacterium (ex Bugula neritina AB1)]|nr:hypothetical protein AB833_31290 [Chromatiales bacterium (ex Bugula neritina AB1)]
MQEESTVEFKTYQKPPLVKRGSCVFCKNPVVENISIPVLPNLKIIPSALLPDELKTNMDFHIFYHRRVVDVDDDKPKYNNFVTSQMAFMQALLKSLRAS